VRVKELADLTGTTVRTIRYYHEIGLLPVPENRAGSREYDLVHVARVIRVRWLTQAGVALSRVANLLASDGGLSGGPRADRESVVTDLKATLVALDDQRDRIAAQRAQVQRLITAVEEHGQLSPMPPGVVRFYDEVERRAQDERVRRVIRRERDFTELAFYRGELPVELEVLCLGFDDEQFAESLATYGEIVDRGDGARMSEEQIAATAARVVQRIRRKLGDDLPRLARSLEPEVLRRAADLYARLAGSNDGRLERAVSDALLAALEEARS
jgi:DNA-binding transcriptional MerR regulator